MNPLGYFFFLVIGVLAVWAIRNWYVRWQLSAKSRDRVFAEVEAEQPVGFDVDPEEMSTLARWLFLAGFRSQDAAATYVGCQCLTLTLGLAIPVILLLGGWMRAMERGLQILPGAVGEVFLPFVYLGPWIVGIGIVLIPWLIVRAARRRRIQDVETDLPVYLELFATLSEAGLGFDAALDRILRSQAEGRPLADEFRTFQVELLAGRPRVQSLRRLGNRVEVSSLTVFVSAVVQAEQVGSGLASVLRRQSDDLRDRRREDFLAKAMTLPVKLVFPLVICFLPGIFAITLGPIFFQFFQFADSLLRNRGVLP